MEPHYKETLRGSALGFEICGRLYSSDYGGPARVYGIHMSGIRFFVFRAFT